MTLNLGVGVTVLSAVAIGTISRSDSDVVAGEFGVYRSGEDRLSVVVEVRVWVAISDVDVERVLPALVDARTTDPLESSEVIALVVNKIAIVDTEGCVVFWIGNVLNLLNLGNDGAVLTAFGAFESGQNASIAQLSGSLVANVPGTSADDLRICVTVVVEQTFFGAERRGVTAGSVAEADHETVLTVDESVDLLLLGFRDGSVGGIVVVTCGRGNRRGGRRVARHGDGSGDGGRDADQLYSGQQVLNTMEMDGR